MKVLLLNLFIFALIATSCYNQRPDITCTTFNEPEDPETPDVLEWEATGRGLHLSFGSKDVKYKKGKVPMLAVTKDKEILAWKGESVSFQAVLWSAFPVEQIECEWENLTTPKGDTISRDIIQTRFVRYILSDTDFINGESDNIAWRDSCLLPDMLDSLPCMNMEAQSVRPLWVTINIPGDVTEGTYNASLKVYSKKNPPQELRLKLDICSRVLPKPENWRFQTNMYVNPDAIADWQQVPVWSDEHYKALTPYVELMKRAGQKGINVTVFNHEHQNTNYQPLIKWKKELNNQMKADFTQFDLWVKFLMENGISSQLDCFVYNPDGDNKLIYLDERNNELIRKQLDVVQDRKIMEQCLKEIINHLKEQNWFGKAVFAIDKGDTETISNLKHLLQEIEPDIKMELVAHDWTSGLLKDVYAANVPSGFSTLKEWFKLRHQQGLETSYELESNVAYPNTYIHSPSAEASWLGWYAAAQGLDGIHIDNFNNWGQKPLFDARMLKASSGSNYLIYPGARSSIRFERLIEGLQDYEKVLVLREQQLTQESAENIQNLELIDEVLSDFVIDRIPRESASQMVKNGQELIKQLSVNN